MLSLWKRTPEPPAETRPQATDDAKRNRQQNIKVSDDCAAAFAALGGGAGHQQGGPVRGHGRRAAGGAAAAWREDRGFGGLAQGCVMSRFRDGIYPLALRASQAAAMLGVSESQLRQWVIEGKVHKPYRVRKNVVLFDAVTLASDWDRMKEEADALIPAIGQGETEEAPNPWDDVLR